MRVLVLKNNDNTNITRTIQFESLEDLRKFEQDFQKVQEAGNMWPSRPLEMQIPYMEVSVTTRQVKDTITELVPKDDTKAN
jgi:hypothetical protein